MLEIRLKEDGSFVVTEFIAEHSHELVPPSCSHLLRSQRKIQSSQAALINQMHSAELKQSQIFSYLTTEARGAQHLNFIQSDCNNFVARKRLEFLQRGDGECMLEYFKKKQIGDKSFFYAIRTNEENEISGCFFCDGKSIRDYAMFGDAMCFDTTFKTNNYNMVCAPLVGINNHGQTILFGCGLLEGETTEACKWLFTVFLQAMEGKQPETIFTDQAQAISNAIVEVLPNSYHRLCLWHIYQNAAKNLSHVFSEFKPFTQDFKRCIYDPETVEEFESSWEALLDDYNLKENTWLGGMYGLREKWAQVYARAHFCAGMTTTQRVESINSFLKAFFSRNLILREFVVQFDKAVASRRETERSAETWSRQTTPNLLGDWSVEVQASKHYTSKIFECFQHEYKKVFNLKLELETDDEITRQYIVKRSGTRRMRRKLTYHPENLPALPAKYLLKRWSHNDTYGEDFDVNGDTAMSSLDSTSMTRYSELSHIAQRMIAQSASDNQTSTFLKNELLQLEKKLESQRNSQKQPARTNRDANSSHHVSENSGILKFQNPKIQKPEGRTKGGRHKSCLESNPTNKKGSSERKDEKELSSQTHEMSAPSNVYQQESVGLANQHPWNMPSLYQSTTFPYGFPHVSAVHGIPSYPLASQLIPPNPLLYDYPFTYSQGTTQPRSRGPTRQLFFSNPSTS